MKNKLSIGILFLCLLSMISCQQDPDMTGKTAQLSKCEVSDIYGTSATVKAEMVSCSSTISEGGYCLSTSPSPIVGNQSTIIFSSSNLGKCTLTGLQQGTTYYLRAFASNDYSVVYGEETEFTTKVEELPQVETSLDPIVQMYKVSCSGRIVSKGNSSDVEVGICYGENSNPTIDNYHITYSSMSPFTEGEVFTCDLTNLKTNSFYYYRAFIKNNAGITYGDNNSFETYREIKGVENTYTWVDLGLPSGIKWATCNIGAANQVEYGYYFAWGETKTKTEYSWENYEFYVSGIIHTHPYCDYDHIILSKYVDQKYHGTIDNKTRLEKTDDAACVKWGGNWRMPTEKEWYELLNYCTHELTTIDGVYGVKVTSTATKNAGYIFLPMAGFKIIRDYQSYDYAGSQVCYWSSDLGGYPEYASFYSVNARHEIEVDDYGVWRASGCPVRAVCP